MIMKTVILILMIYGSGGQGGKAMISQEFTSMEACINAGDKAKKEFSGFYISPAVYICVDK